MKFQEIMNLKTWFLIFLIMFIFSISLVFMSFCNTDLPGVKWRNKKGNFQDLVSSLFLQQSAKMSKCAHTTNLSALLLHAWHFGLWAVSCMDMSIVCHHLKTLKVILKLHCNIGLNFFTFLISGHKFHESFRIILLISWCLSSNICKSWFSL